MKKIVNVALLGPKFRSRRLRAIERYLRGAKDHDYRIKPMYLNDLNELEGKMSEKVKGVISSPQTFFVVSLLTKQWPTDGLISAYGKHHIHLVEKDAKLAHGPDIFVDVGEEFIFLEGRTLKSSVQQAAKRILEIKRQETRRSAIGRLATIPELILLLPCVLSILFVLPHLSVKDQISLGTGLDFLVAYGDRYLRELAHSLHLIP